MLTLRYKREKYKTRYRMEKNTKRKRKTNMENVLKGLAKGNRLKRLLTLRYKRENCKTRERKEKIIKRKEKQIWKKF